MYCEHCKREMDGICKMCGIYRSGQFMIDRFEMIKENERKEEKMTNKEKFKQVFGIDVNPLGILNCAIPGLECIHSEDDVQCCDCVYDHFWEKEYIERGDNNE